MASWLRPTTLAEALAERARLGSDAQVVGGGVWVTLLLQQGLIRPETFLALDRVRELDGIRQEDGALVLGAGSRLSAVASDPRVPSALARTYAVVANRRVRNQGTVGGNLAEADYASDPATTLIALDATVELASEGGRRELPVADLALGHYETRIEPHELLVAVRVPTSTARGAYLKFVSRSSEDRPCAGIAAVVGLGPRGEISHLSVVAGAVQATPVTFPEVTARAIGRPPSDDLLREIGQGYAERVDPLDDMRGSAAYRRRLVAELVPRAIRQAIA